MTTMPRPCHDPADRAAAGEDFGHLVRREPWAVLRPASPGEVVRAVGWAVERGLPVAAQGRRHSVFGRAQAADGVVCEMTRLRTVHEIRPDRVVVDAGASWREVLAATLPLGLAPPVLPDYLDLSVGGTVAVGGVGAATGRRGMVTDHLLELEVVTGTARMLACSPARNPELFDAVRAGLGQVGIVTRAVLSLVPAPRRVRRFLLHYPDPAAMLGDARLLAAGGAFDGRFDSVQGAALPTPGGWAFRLEAVRGFTDAPPADRALLAGLSDDRGMAQPDTLSYPDHLGRLDALERALRGNGQWAFPHPWLMTFVGDRAVQAVLEQELAGLAPAADLGRFGQVGLSAVAREPVTGPLCRLPDEPLSFTVNLVRIPDTDDTDEAARLVAGNRAGYERVRAAGGTLYPVSAVELSAVDWRGHFGPAFRRLAAAKRQHDPQHLLTPGYQVFPRP